MENKVKEIRERSNMIIEDVKKNDVLYKIMNGDGIYFGVEEIHKKVFVVMVHNDYLDLIQHYD